MPGIHSIIGQNLLETQNFVDLTSYLMKLC